MLYIKYKTFFTYCRSDYLTENTRYDLKLLNSLYSARWRHSQIFFLVRLNLLKISAYKSQDKVNTIS